MSSTGFIIIHGILTGWTDSHPQIEGTKRYKEGWDQGVIKKDKTIFVNENNNILHR